MCVGQSLVFNPGFKSVGIAFGCKTFVEFVDSDTVCSVNLIS